jgi:hypothetical protein
MLNILQYHKIPVGEMFQMGLVEDSPTGCNMSGSQKMLRYVAVKGGVDWALYVGTSDQSFDEIRRGGDKPSSEPNIRNTIDCDDQVFSLYRY